ncbi:FAD-dependent monooxygenase [Serratia proteamaculans]
MSFINKSKVAPVIVGAGIGGLTLAAILSSREIKCSVHEKLEEGASGGFGLNIQPLAVKILIDLGLWDELEASGITTRAHRYVDHKGQTIYEELRGVSAGFPAPQISIQRSELMEIVKSKVDYKYVDMEFNSDVSVDKLKKHAYLDSESAELIVGADGINSIVREFIFPESMSLIEGGVVFWRGMSCTSEFLDGRTVIIANDESSVRLIAYPVSKRHQKKGKDLVNWVVIVPASFDLPFEGEGSRQETSDFLLNLLKHWDFDFLDLKSLIKTSGKIKRTKMADREPIEKWSYKNHVLMGDAAHLMYPIGANGASQCIIDALALSNALCESPDIFSAIEKYEACRVDTVSKVVYANREMFLSEIKSQGSELNKRAVEIEAITSAYKVNL